MESIRYKLKLKLIAIITYIGVTFLLVYFTYFPFIINALLSNIIIVITTFVIISSIIYGSFLIKKKIDLLYLLPQSLYLTFIARAIPNLRLENPPLNDPYYYFVATENIINTGTLTPTFNWWYDNVGVLLHWPIINIFTTIIVYITNLNPILFVRYQEPLLGILFFTSVFLLANVVTKNYSISFLAALFASFCDIIIFYQSEYHPQGLSFIFFTLIIYLLIKSISSKFYNFFSLLMLIAIVFTFSHYFTSILISMILMLYIILLTIFYMLSKFKKFPKDFRIFINDIGINYRYCIILISIPIFYHIIVYNRFIIIALGMVNTNPIPNAAILPLTTNTIPFITSFLSSFKWGLFILSIISIIYILIDKNTNHFRLAVLTICVVIAGILGNYIITSPLDRIIALYTPFAAIFASITLFRFNSQWFTTSNKNIKLILSVLIASLIIIAAFFNSQTPAYFFKDSEINTYYWYSNDLSSIDLYSNTGAWINSYVPNDKTYLTEFDTLMVAFYYGKKPLEDIKLISSSNIGDLKNIYFIVNPKLPYKYWDNIDTKFNFIDHNNLIYTNGILSII